jgi:hypothetical protein
MHAAVRRNPARPNQSQNQRTSAVTHYFFGCIEGPGHASWQPRDHKLLRFEDGLGNYFLSSTKPHPSPVRGVCQDRGRWWCRHGACLLKQLQHKLCSMKVKIGPRPMISDGPVNQNKPSHDCNRGQRTDRQCWPPKGQGGLQPRGIIVVSRAHRCLPQAG